MKRIALTTLIVIIGIQAFAQPFEFGVSGGAFVANVPSGSNYHKIVAPMASLKAIYATRHYQLGIDAGLRAFYYKNYEQLKGDLFLFPANPPPLVSNRTLQVPLKAIANRKWSFRHTEIYAGVFAGFQQSSWKIIHPVQPADQQLSASVGKPFAGIQAGATQYVGKHTGLNLELAAECHDLQLPYNPLARNAFVFPFSAGVRYRL